MRHISCSYVDLQLIMLMQPREVEPCMTLFWAPGRVKINKFKYVVTSKV